MKLQPSSKLVVDQLTLGMNDYQPFTQFEAQYETRFEPHIELTEQLMVELTRRIILYFRTDLFHWDHWRFIV